MLKRPIVVNVNLVRAVAPKALNCGRHLPSDHNHENRLTGRRGHLKRFSQKLQSYGVNLVSHAFRKDGYPS